MMRAQIPSQLLLPLAAVACVAGSAQAAVTISTAATQNMSCSGGVCMPTATNAVLNVTDLESLLASGNVTVTTTGSGVQAKDMDVTAALSWSSQSVLSLDAYRSVTVAGAVSVTGTGGVALATNDGGKKGLLSFSNGGALTFQDLSSPLTINGKTYTLENSVMALANAIAASPKGDYALASNYDAGGDGTYDQAPIPTEFEGKFDGLGNTISNLTIVNTAGAKFGLFAEVVHGELRHIGMVNASISTKDDRSEDLGALAGDVESSIVDQAFSSGTVSSLAQAYTGGLIGYTVGDTIKRSSSTATVSGGNASSVLGGLIGNSDVGDVITLCYATGNVSAGKRTAVGGLVGQTRGNISNSYATGTASGGATSGVGGLLGGNIGTIANVYAYGSVSSPYAAGGLIGINETTVADGYSTGVVSGNPTYGGGFIGYDTASPGSLSDNYWDTTTSGITNLSQGAGNVANDPGIKGKTTQQLQAGLPAGFDKKIWAENPNINGGLPYLIANPPQ